LFDVRVTTEDSYFALDGLQIRSRKGRPGIFQPPTEVGWLDFRTFLAIPELLSCTQLYSVYWSVGCMLSPTKTGRASHVLLCYTAAACHCGMLLPGRGGYLTDGVQTRLINVHACLLAADRSKTITQMICQRCSLPVLFV